MEVIQLSGRRILSIDGSPSIRNFLAERFTESGGTVAQAGSAAEARRLFGDGGAFDLVILDLLLPDEKGLALLRDLRQLDDDATIVLLTAAGGGASATAAMRRGADAYIEKQHITEMGDHQYLFEALTHAFEHRAGVVARRRLETMKADFYSMVTHDLRNPAGNVLVALKLLLGGKVGELSVRQEELSQLALRSASKVIGLINNYLDYAKIDAGYLRLDLTDADLAETARRAVADAKTRADLKLISLDLVAPTHLPAVVDEAKLEQVLDNLISNALKYTPEGGRVTVVASADEAAVTLEVQDSGVGIPAEQLGQLFTKYHRVPGQQTAQIQGTGLGLLIVKEIVEAHGGTVRAESPGSAGQGSAFIVRVPLRLPTSAAADRALPS